MDGFSLICPQNLLAYKRLIFHLLPQQNTHSPTPPITPEPAAEILYAGQSPFPTAFGIDTP